MSKTIGLIIKKETPKVLKEELKEEVKVETPKKEKNKKFEVKEEK